MGQEVALARAAGLRIGETGVVDVDRTERSRSHEAVYAAGDCSETFHRQTGEAVHVALGTHANKQGPGGRLGDRGPGGPLRRRPGHRGDQGGGERIDVSATAIRARLTAEDFAGSDLSYAPPFSPVHDPVVVAARVASRVEQG
jgi:NADPH-dependent 2,4-dienoyl-CoA reductase/sulfur reductase-like enzyme